MLFIWSHLHAFVFLADGYNAILCLAWIFVAGESWEPFDGTSASICVYGSIRRLS